VNGSEQKIKMRKKDIWKMMWIATFGGKISTPWPTQSQIWVLRWTFNKNDTLDWREYDKTKLFTFLHNDFCQFKFWIFNAPISIFFCYSSEILKKYSAHQTREKTAISFRQQQESWCSDVRISSDARMDWVRYYQFVKFNRFY